MNCKKNLYHNDNPKVSIVIPVYNGSNYLKDAIDSALAQTYCNCEVIVVNDGSNDCGETEKIAGLYGNKIRYFYKENGGVASAVNVAIKNMDGEYFAWLSHDDVYYPDKIKIQMDALKDNGDMLMPVFGEYDVFDTYENTVKSYHMPEMYDMSKVTSGIYPVIMGLVNTVTVMVHKSHFDRIGLFDESLLTTQDYDMWFRLFREQKLLYIKKPLIKWRLHNKQGIVTIPEHYQNCCELHMRFINEIKEQEVMDLFGSKYRFYYEMMQFMKVYGLNEVEAYVRKKFSDTDESIIEEDKRKKFQSWLHYGNESSSLKICLYGAGNNGKFILHELLIRGIKVSVFADRNVELIGTEIMGIICKKIQDLDPKEYLVIVTPDEYEEICLTLKSRGFQVIVGREIIKASLLYEVMPLKKYLL